MSERPDRQKWPVPFPTFCVQDGNVLLCENEPPLTVPAEPEKFAQPVAGMWALPLVDHEELASGTNWLDP